MTGVAVRPVVLAAVDDMFFWSKIEVAARCVGVEVAQARNPDELERHLSGPVPSLIILDLNSRSCAPIAAIRRIKTDARFSKVPLIGFLSHVQEELERSSLQAGCDQVMPRSAFSRNIAKILESASKPGSAEHEDTT